MPAALTGPCPLTAARPALLPRSRGFVEAREFVAPGQQRPEGTGETLPRASLLFDVDDVLQTDQAEKLKSRAFRLVKCFSFAEPVAPASPTSKVEHDVASLLQTLGGNGRDVQALAGALRAALGLEVVVVSPSRSVTTNAGRLTLNLADPSPYIVVVPPSSESSGNPDDDVIVDPSFKAVFTLGGATASQQHWQHYVRKLAALPEVWVGTRSMLRLRVNEMATAISLAFTAQGLAVPLWRSRKVLLQRWDLVPGALLGGATAAGGSGRAFKRSVSADLPSPTGATAASSAGSAAGDAGAAAEESFDELLRSTVIVGSSSSAASDAGSAASAGAQRAMEGRLERRASDSSDGSASGDDLSDFGDMSVSPVSVLDRAGGLAPKKEDKAAAAMTVRGAMQPARVVVGFAF